MAWYCREQAATSTCYTIIQVSLSARWAPTAVLVVSLWPRGVLRGPRYPESPIASLGCAAHSHMRITGPPHFPDGATWSSGDGKRSARYSVASCSSDRLPPTPHKLHAAACAVLCGGPKGIATSAERQGMGSWGTDGRRMYVSCTCTYIQLGSKVVPGVQRELCLARARHTRTSYAYPAHHSAPLRQSAFFASSGSLALML